MTAICAVGFFCAIYHSYTILLLRAETPRFELIGAASLRR
jgi:hypothetical protein